MRLTSDQVQTIKTQAALVFGPGVQVWLFGSRTRDDARGGDIDLLVSTPRPVDRPALLPAELAARLQIRLGDQHIDIVLEAPNLQSLPIHQVAHSEGILL